MTTGNETDPRDDALAKAWRAQSQDLPAPALDATILAAAHRAVGSGPRDARKQATEATRPQRWWMPLAAAATIGVVVIGILQVAPQAPVDIVVGERADVASRVAPVIPTAPATQGNVVAEAKEAAPAKNDKQASADVPATTMPSSPAPATIERAKKAASVVATAPPPSAPAAPAALTDARKQVAAAPSMPAPEPFPADKLSRKNDAEMTSRQNERKDTVEPQSAPAPAMMAQAPLKKESIAGASGSLAAAGSAAKVGTAARERDTARDERSAPAAASTDQARSTASPAELQVRARDPDAWIARIRKLRDDGRVAEAVAELREFRRYVPDAETRLPTDLRQWVPNP